MDDSSNSGKARPIQQSHCNTCSLSALCLPVSLNLTDIDRLDTIINKSQPLKKGELLFDQGQSFGSIFAIRAGSVKTYTVTAEGEEQITGFYFPGELIGLSGIDSGQYPNAARVLETTTVCNIPFSRLDELAGEMPELRRQIMRTMSREISDDQQMLLLLSKKTAEQRLATFLIRLSERFRIRGYSKTRFRLSMSRNEIANYLGLAIETVSRLFTRFQKNGLIQVEGKEIDITDLAQLYLHSGECPNLHQTP
ncbi:fumarate/nitrate reduction transcriptional regulator Fnr [Marinobacterium rhizophilum]|uniref:fumarate/nitrate reduction transcriptional regulator Fnr n=1 Tax=Marinobacterium rhizophilum TaxID=420402 RepID=UPI00035C1BA6|nr:fumarate/nitrate reduction transcriptional regulator Fnr [Marinobacterium rhizophilum]